MEKVDKFSQIIIPNCKPTPSQESKLQSIPFVTEPDDSVSEESLSSSSSDESSEQQAEIVMVTLSDSTDDYQTPPEHQSYSQNSSNDGQVAAAAAVGIDRDGDAEVAINSGENLGVVDDETEKIENEELIVETVETEEIESLDEVADQVFDEMPEREEGGATGLFLGKRKFPSTINTKGEEEDGYCKHRKFLDSLDRVLELLAGEGKGKENNDEEVDFVETAKMHGLRFPRPRWLPGDGSDDSRW